MLTSASPVTVVSSQDIVITGSRIPTREDIGDYKLYTLPEQVTVAAKSQKQVALLDQSNVGVELLYRATVWRGDPREPQLVLRTINKSEWGLGLPLPAGTFALFDQYRGRPILLGEGTTADRAVGEKTEIELGEASNVKLKADTEDMDNDSERITLTVTNDEPRPIAFEAKIVVGGWTISGFSEQVYGEGRDRIWRVVVPANSSRSVKYTLREND